MNIAIIVARAVFAALIIFELLNVLKILELNTQYTWLGLLLTAIFAFAVLEIAAYKHNQQKGEQLHWSAWLLTALALGTDAAGDFFFLYNRFAWWDQAVHLSLSATVCYLLFLTINAFWIDHFRFALLFKKGKARLALYLAASSTLSLGVLYEVEEYAEDLIFGSQRSGLGTDTANDLLFNLLGVILAGILIGGWYMAKQARVSALKKSQI